MLFVTNSGLSIFETPNVEAAVAAIDSRMSCFVFQESSISLYYLCDDPLASAPLSRESGLDSNLLKRLTRVGFNFTHSFRWGIFAFARSFVYVCLSPSLRLQQQQRRDFMGPAASVVGSPG